MKTILIPAIAVFALSACMQGPTTTDDVRKITARGGLSGSQTVVTVPRSLAAVTGSLQGGAQKCMNRTVSQTVTTPGPYGPRTMTVVTDYSATVRAAGGRTELSLYQEIRGGMLPQPKGISYVVDAAPVAGGTQVVIHSARFGSGEMNKTVEQWVRGGALTCPKLPGMS